MKDFVSLCSFWFRRILNSRDFYLRHGRLNDSHRNVGKKNQLRGRMDHPRWYITRAGRETEDTVNPNSWVGGRFLIKGDGRYFGVLWVLWRRWLLVARRARRCVTQDMCDVMRRYVHYAKNEFAKVYSYVLHTSPKNTPQKETLSLTSSSYTLVPVA